MTFTVQSGSVVMTGEHRPVKLSDCQVDRLLDLFEDAGAVDLFHQLYDAQRLAMGELHIPRTTSLCDFAAYRKARMGAVVRMPLEVE